MAKTKRACRRSAFCASILALRALLRSQRTSGIAKKPTAYACGRITVRYGGKWQGLQATAMGAPEVKP